MVQLVMKSIFVTVIMINIIILNGFSESSNISESKPQLNNNKTLGFPSPAINITLPEKNSYEEIDLKVSLSPNQNKYLKDWYQILNSTLVVNNSSKLCPSDNCKYELKNEEMAEAFGSNERSMVGKITVDTGVSKIPMNLSSIWKVVKEFEINDKTVQIIKGSLMINGNSSESENKYEINGTLSKYNDKYFLDIKARNN
jgi:hypothetical protein